MKFAALTLALAICSCSGPQVPEGPPWRPLFNGNSLDGWVVNGSGIWRVQDGVIWGGQAGDPKRAGTLATVGKYRDFELTLEFLIDEHGKYNSGVYLRNDPMSTGQTTYQVNIGRGVVGEFCGGVVIHKGKGIEWLSKGDERDAIRKPGEWNSMRIVARGAHLEVDLNGVHIVDVTDPAPVPRYLQEGAIALQTYGAEGHDGFVMFRNLKIREF